MKILHYTLGLPPYRTGGLTKYANDLIEEQAVQGNQITHLFPGYFTVRGKTKIKHHQIRGGGATYEIVNPLPVPLLGGIGQPERFCISTDERIYRDFLERIRPDIIHIHTLMGIHKEFFTVARELKIKTLFTSHDYFGLCPRGNLFDHNHEICKDFNNGLNCTYCNKNSYSMKLIYLMQSRTYRYFKTSKILNHLKNYKKKKLNQSNKDIANADISSKQESDAYKKLREFYFQTFQLIDYYHFNSSIAKQQYEKFLSIKGQIVPITHQGIQDNRITIHYNNSNALKITYLGPLDHYKGYHLLDTCLGHMLKLGFTNWQLNVYGNGDDKELDSKGGYIKFHGKYRYSQLKDIFASTDIVIVPSVWNETFGYVGLEAISHGVPVIITENVGFKDVVQQEQLGIVIQPNFDQLINVLVSILQDRSILQSINQRIVSCDIDFSMRGHAKKIQVLYNDLIQTKHKMYGEVI